MSGFFDFLKILVICMSALLALVLVLVVVISRMPNNPLRHILGALAQRIGLTAGGLMLMVPETAIPVVGEIGDIVTVVIVLYYWSTFFRDIQKTSLGTRTANPPIKRVN